MNDREKVMITRVGHESSLTDSLASDESLEATAHLLRSPENARRLAAAIERLEASDGAPQESATASKASAPPDR
jgi:antitoxin YefM